MMAIRLKYEKIARYLLEIGVDISLVCNESNVFGPDNIATPLKLAIESDLFEIVKLLIEKGAEINERPPKSSDFLVSSPILYSIFYNRAEIFKFLVENGADLSQKYLNYKTGNLNTVLDCALIYKSGEEIIKILREKGCELLNPPVDFYFDKNLVGMQDLDETRNVLMKKELEMKNLQLKNEFFIKLSEIRNLRNDSTIYNLQQTIIMQQKQIMQSNAEKMRKDLET
ncbi:ankyrin repeat protein, putative [Trichomonas vaginalis G3]|uniref:Ankyrin repeat protein, putative n=1 Tax=Trichomonas vaginalis (strain ATCC PRA-98 / G3) TaxID=412133 RepID=A2GMV4_TRIV3|nr:ankyrin repeat protein, putative [Trichomonas vaginalis G3]|eukprot:XP_001294442.1 ankyrin repeat protein [Trichomonas vaginalis G3]